MTYGFIVLNHDEVVGWSKKFNSRYLELREKLFRYAPEHPQQLINLNKDPSTGLRRILLKNAHRGLLKTREEAETLMKELQKEYASCPLEIMLMEYPDAHEIRWITA